MSDGQQIEKGTVFKLKGDKNTLYRARHPPSGGWVPVETIEGAVIVNSVVPEKGIEEVVTGNEAVDFAERLENKSAGKRRRTRHRKSRKNKRTRRH